MSNIAKDNDTGIRLSPSKPSQVTITGSHLMTESITLQYVGIVPDYTIMSPFELTDTYYETLDLLREDPPNSGYYCHIGRISDTFFMSNGKRTYPTPMENEIRNAGVVKQCTVIGENRERTATLVEINEKRAAKYTPEEVNAQVYEAVWTANKGAPEHSAAITVPELVYILPSGKSLPTIPKGPVSRRDPVREFEEEISQLYSVFLGESA